MNAIKGRYVNDYETYSYKQVVLHLEQNFEIWEVCVEVHFVLSFLGRGCLISLVSRSSSTWVGSSMLGRVVAGTGLDLRSCAIANAEMIIAHMGGLNVANSRSHVCLRRCCPLTQRQESFLFALRQQDLRLLSFLHRVTGPLHLKYNKQDFTNQEYRHSIITKITCNSPLSNLYQNAINHTWIRKKP